MADRNGNKLSFGYPSLALSATDSSALRFSGGTDDYGGIAAKTCFEYDAANNLIQVTDPDDKITKYAYNAANRRTSTIYAYSTSDATTWTMTYTPLGQLATLAKPSGGTISYNYNQVELLSTRTYGGTMPSATDSFTYYPNHLLATANGGLYGMNVSRGTAASNATIGTWYDGANRLLQEQQSYGTLSKTMSYQYTKDSLVSQLTCPDGTTTIGRNYTADRLLYQVVVGGGTAATFGYDTADRKTGLVFANGASTSWTLDNASRVTALSHVSSSGTLQAWGYGYTPANDPLAQLDQTTGTMGNAFQYDGMHRLSAFQQGTVISGSNTVTSPSSSQSWTLSAAGDWSPWNTGAGSVSLSESRSYNDVHALLSRTTISGTSSQGYDSDWNQNDDGVAYKFAYDANDQLQQVFNRGTMALSASYAYDALGRRALKFVTSGSASTVYFYSGNQVVQEYDGTAGSLNATYSYGDYVDEPLTMDRGGSRYYYHANRLHSVYLLSDSGGNVSERYSYTPYGVATVWNSTYTSSGSVSSVGNPYLFTGREFDAEAALYNYRARTYDPVQGRFKQLDPIGLRGGLNLYCYCNGSPLNIVDPFGLLTWTTKYGMERHHWFPQKDRAQIESLCKKVNFSIDAFVTPLLVAVDYPELSAFEKLGYKLRGTSLPTPSSNPRYNDHNWIEYWRNPPWPSVVEKNLASSPDCCTFLTKMVPEIQNAYRDLQARARSRGDTNLYKDSFGNALRVYLNKGEGGTFPRTMEVIQGESWYYYSYDRLRTTSLLLKATKDACDSDCKKPVDVFRLVYEKKERTGAGSGGGLQKDFTVPLAVGSLGAGSLLEASAGAAAAGIEGVGEDVVAPSAEPLLTPLRPNPVVPNGAPINVAP